MLEICCLNLGKIMKYRILTTLALTVVSASQALAGGALLVPLPIAGAAGPVGLGVAIIGYGAYRYYKSRQEK